MLGWLWLGFDEDAYHESMMPPSIVLEMPAAPEPTTPEPVESATGREPTPPPDAPATDSTESPTTPADTTAPPDAPPQRAEAPATEERPVTPAPAPKEEKVALAPAPQPELLADGPDGPLPVIAPDGRVAWQVYARPFTAPDPKTPRISLVIAGLGLSQPATEAAIQQLPGAVSLAFMPYARGLETWIAKARAAGHEVLLELPMEPFDYPRNDPGPHTLLAAGDPESNLERLDWLLSRFSGYVGVTNFMGGKFTTSEPALRPILGEIKERGLLYLDSRASQNSVAGRIARDLELPRAINNRFIDSEASRVAIDARLFELERIAKSAGVAVGIGFPYPVTIERISHWASGLAAKRMVLAPLSAVANAQAVE
jgi:polysaccharide deacetylase 2 family uncharacterized protein YibQ